MRACRQFRAEKPIGAPGDSFLLHGIAWITMNAVRILVAATAIGSPLAAQWIKYPTPGTPRARDGKPNLAAPAPHTHGVPDLSGVWQPAGNLPSQGSGDLSLNPLLAWFGTNSKDGLPYRQETREAMSKRRMKDSHYLTCVTPGGPQMLVLPTMRIQCQLPSDFHRWTRAAGRSAADVERLFGGKVGGRYTRGAFGRISERSNTRYTGKSTYQCRQDHRALSPTVVRKARNRGHG
jgi:hypothetical protein